MEFRILGPTEADDDGKPLPLGGAKQRALLAILLLHANEVVSADEKAREMLGFEATTSLDEMLDEVIPWIRDAIVQGTI